MRSAELEVFQIVLAAGKSSRMGTSKPLLQFDGRTALDLVLEAGAAAGVCRSIVVVGVERDRVIEAHVKAVPRVEWVVNPDPDSDQLRSLQLGLRALPEGGCFVFAIHPVDCPLVLAQDYELLVSAVRSDTDGCEVFIPRYGERRGHPVLCRGSLREPFLALVPGQTARDVIRAAKRLEVETPNAAVARDMDRPQDYSDLLDEYRRTRG